ncbi:MAG: addiction module protein [Methylotenera sp.]|nr:addiction module protein [Methylotenera sp.]
MSLTLSEKILITEELWDSIHQEAQQLPVNPEQMALLDERLRAYELDQNKGTSWTEVLARIKEKE